MSRIYGPTPQQGPGTAGTRPPKGWMPPLGTVLQEVGVYDNDSGYWVGLPLQALTMALVQAEKQHTVDKIDPRNGLVKVTVPIGTATAATKTAELEVPSDEVWYLCEHEIAIHTVGGLTDGNITVNFTVSSFPKVDGAEKKYYIADDPQVYLTTKGDKVSGGGLTATQSEIAAGDVYDHKLVPVGGDGSGGILKDEFKRDFRDADELGTELRLVGGNKLTLEATVGGAAIAGAAVDVYLRVWGRRGKRLA